MDGTVDDWNAVMALSREDSLTEACRTLAWQHAPSEAEACTAEQLENGLNLLEAANIHEGRDRLTWWRLNALLREGKKDQAMDVLDERRLDASSDVTDLLPLVVSLGNERANEWLMRFLDDVDDQALFHVLQTEALDHALRLKAAQRLCDERGPMWEEGRTTAQRAPARSPGRSPFSDRVFLRRHAAIDPPLHRAARQPLGACHR